VNYETEKTTKLQEQFCVQLPTSADNVALPAFATARRAAAAYGARRDRSINPLRLAYSSKPTEVLAAVDR